MQGIAVSYHCCRKCDGSVFNFYENDGSFGQFVLKNVVVLYICSVSMVYSPVLPALSTSNLGSRNFRLQIAHCKLAYCYAC